VSPHADRLQAEWDRPGAYNACRLCNYSPDKGATCAHPEVARAIPVPTARARSNESLCGVEARFLSFPGLEPAGESVRRVYACLVQPSGPFTPLPGNFK
jgi:hypothetical protein